MKIVCVGDSNTYGFDPREYGGGRYRPESRWVDLVAAKTGWEVCNWGENGQSIPRRGIPLPEDADLVIVMLGTNDLLQGGNADGVAESMGHFLQSLTIPAEKILLVAPPPLVRGAWVSDPAEVRESQALADRYRTLAQALGAHFADAGAWGISLAYDGVHFTEQGHRTFAARLLESLPL